MSGLTIGVLSVCGLIIIGGGIAVYVLKDKSKDEEDNTPSRSREEKATASKKTNKSGPLFKIGTFVVGVILLALGVGILVSTGKYIWDIINPPPSGRKGGIGYARDNGPRERRPSPYGSSLQASNPETEKKARELFQASKYNFTPGQVDELVDICVRESGCNQFKDGHPYRGVPPEGNTKDVGAMQINEDYWGERASREGFDFINSFDDNLAFAAELYNEQGGKPWANSEKNSRLNSETRAANAKLPSKIVVNDFTAPLTNWKRVYVNGDRFSVVADGDIYIRTNTGQNVLFKKNGRVQLGDHIIWLEFQSAQEEEVAVHVTT